MILKSLTVQNLGSVDFFSCDFFDRLNVVKTRYIDTISAVLRFVLHHTSPPLPDCWVREDTRIDAHILLEGEHYLLVATPNQAQKDLCSFCYDERGVDVTLKYRYRSLHCAEQDVSDVFEGREDTMLLRCLQYTNADFYASPEELSAQTNGFSDTGAFRRHLRAFLDHFQPELLHDGKQYEIVLEKSGKYAVRCKIDTRTPPLLSESERTVFRYLCFLKTAEFWQGFEEVRNLHFVQKPLIIKDFLERLDASVNPENLLRRTAQLNRQILLLTLPQSENRGAS